MGDDADVVDVAGDKMSAEAGVGGEGAFEVDEGAFGEGLEIGFAACFFEEVEAEEIFLDGDDGEAAAVVGDAVADFCAFVDDLRFYGEAPALIRLFKFDDFACFFDDACEHGEK